MGAAEQNFLFVGWLIVGVLVIITMKLHRIAKAVDETNKLLGRQTQP
jgi:hypothetical protein